MRYWILMMAFLWIPHVMAQDTRSWVLPLFYPEKKEAHCTAVLISPQKALTARHCLGPDASLVLGPRRIPISRVALIRDDPALFPLYDIAVLHLAAPLERPSFPGLAARGPRPDQILVGHGYGVRASCQGKECTQLKTWNVRVKQNINGQRLFGLFMADKTSGDDPCLGDSGGPLFQKSGKDWNLVGLVAGQSLELFPGAGFCRFKTSLFTSVATFRPWIETEKFPEPQPQSYSPGSWDQRCHGESHKQNSWALTQTLLFQLARSRGGWMDPRIQKAFLACQGMDSLLQEHFQRGESFRIQPARLLPQDHLLTGLRKLELIDVEQADLEQLRSMPHLEQLTLIGWNENLDLRVLRPLRQLSKLTLKHGSTVRHVDELKGELPGLKQIDIYDVKVQ